MLYDKVLLPKKTSIDLFRKRFITCSYSPRQGGEGGVLSTLSTPPSRVSGHGEVRPFLWNNPYDDAAERDVREYYITDRRPWGSQTISLKSAPFFFFCLLSRGSVLHTTVLSLDQLVGKTVMSPLNIPLSPVYKKVSIWFIAKFVGRLYCAGNSATT